MTSKKLTYIGLTLLILIVVSACSEDETAATDPAADLTVAAGTYAYTSGVAYTSETGECSGATITGVCWDNAENAVEASNQSDCESWNWEYCDCSNADSFCEGYGATSEECVAMGGEVAVGTGNWNSLDDFMSGLAITVDGSTYTLTYMGTEIIETGTWTQSGTTITTVSNAICESDCGETVAAENQTACEAYVCTNCNDSSIENPENYTTQEDCENAGGSWRMNEWYEGETSTATATTTGFILLNEAQWECENLDDGVEVETQEECVSLGGTWQVDEPCMHLTFTAQ